MLYLVFAFLALRLWLEHGCPMSILNKQPISYLKNWRKKTLNFKSLLEIYAGAWKNSNWNAWLCGNMHHKPKPKRMQHTLLLQILVSSLKLHPFTTLWDENSREVMTHEMTFLRNMGEDGTKNKGGFVSHVKFLAIRVDHIARRNVFQWLCGTFFDFGGSAVL